MQDIIDAEAYVWVNPEGVPSLDNNGGDKIFYEYGGMKIGQNTKLHIYNNDGLVLCGTNSNWMEAGEPINTDGYIHGQEHLPDIKNKNSCKKCLKIWMNLKK